MQENYLVTPQNSQHIQAQAASQAEQDSLQSVHDLELRRVREFTIPSVLRLVSFFALSVVFLVVTNWQNILKILNRTVVSNEPFLKGLPTYLSYYTDNQIVSWITIIIFWGTVGLAVYTLFWLGMAFFTAARNELIVETAFSNRGHFWDKIRVPLIKLVMLVVVAILLMVTLRIGAPVWSELVSAGLYHLTNAPVIGVLQIMAALLGAMINLHIVWTSILLFRHADGIF